MSFDHLAVFAAVAFASVLVPGPDFALITGTSLRHGRKAGMHTAWGIATGVLLWGFATAFGLSAILRESANAFRVVKLAGAGYLIFLGIAALRAAAKGAAVEMSFGDESAPKRAFASFRKGLLTNLLNPKVGIFFLTLIPQFAGKDATFWDIELLALILATIAFAWFTTYAIFVARLRPILSSARSQRRIEGATGVALIGVGARVALEN